MELLVVLAIVGVLLAITLPAVQSAREGGRRAQCANNLKQLGLAMTLHEQTHRHLPTGGWGFRWIGDPARGADGRQPGGWIFGLLPQLEQRALYDMADGGFEGDREAQLSRMIQTPLEVLHCPSRRSADLYPNRWQPRNCDPARLVAKTDYAANAGDVFLDVGGGPITLEQADAGAYAWPRYGATGVCFLRSRVRMADVLDGTTQTYLIGEKNVPSREYHTGEDRGDDQSAYSGDDFDTLRWTSPEWPPLNDRPGEFTEARFGAAHSAGCNFVYCDGSVSLVEYSIDPEVHRSLGNRLDGKVVKRP